MRAPAWFRNQLGVEGNRVLVRALTEGEAAVRLTDQILSRDDQALTQRIVAEYVRRQLKPWLTGRRRAAEDGEDGQLDLFPEIPRQLEVAPGRFVDQAWMTRRDWTAAVKQAKTKASNATGHADAIERIADKVLPLLTNDDLTTADVWKIGGTRGEQAI